VNSYLIIEGKSMKSKNVVRCSWSLVDELDIRYHDKEWGVPVKNDKKQFEFLILEGMQAGLSWRTILNKRENFRKAFDYFDFNKIGRPGRNNQRKDQD